MRERSAVTLDKSTWKVSSEGYLCRFCNDGIWRDAKNCPRHLSSAKHKKAYDFHERLLKDRSKKVAVDLNDDWNSELGSNSIYTALSGSAIWAHDNILSDIDENASISTSFDSQDTFPRHPSPDSPPGWDFHDNSADFDESEELDSHSNYASDNGDALNAEIDGLQIEGDTSSDNEVMGDNEDDNPNPFSNIYSSTIMENLSTEDDCNDWFPWPNKLYCILDIFRNLPRSILSEKQHALILWGLRSLGILNVPSETTVKSVIDSIQYMCGIKTIRYKGALGHIYYVNDFSALIAQEMANPKVRKYIEFYPEDAGDKLQNACQGRRWLHELEPDLLTPMIRQDGQDFYTLEPAILSDGSVVMPVRWFKYCNAFHAFSWRMLPSPFGVSNGWYIHQYEMIRISASDFNVSFPFFVDSYRYRDLSDPRIILGVFEKANEPSKPWTLTDPTTGNKWRELAKGQRVYAFPIWLYCDDTSGNSSKKWNEHNSYLFTPAGLPQEHVHRPYNVHFLCTSNIAPPLEMLEGVVDQLMYAQKNGIWAWDHIEEDNVLLIPSVMGLLGDNPMQSEFACHVGMNGNLFCRVCKATMAITKPDALGLNAVTAGNNESDRASLHSNQSDRVSVSSTGRDSGKSTSADANRQVGVLKMSDWVKRAKEFLKIDTLRHKEGTLENLHEIFVEVKRIGGKSKSLKLKTKYGVKDTYREFFVQKIFGFTIKLNCTNAEKQQKVNEYIQTLPSESNMLSPIWRIREIDPHRDTPVELLHVVLLGFVKYLWRDAIAKLNDEQKSLLITRLASSNTSGLNIPPLAGKTLVQYSGSLTGRDFRALVQIAPFVLYNFLPLPCFRAWLALSLLVPLLWQPVIYKKEEYLVKVQNAVDYFLDCIVAWTPRWFNKPKFHILLHIINHIRRYGPAHIFATETFESHNALIRDLSVHSNRQAPSRDIGYGFANANRIRHLISGAKFLYTDSTKAARSNKNGDNDSTTARCEGSMPPKVSDLRTVGPKVLQLFEQDNVLRQLCGYLIEGGNTTRGGPGFKVQSDRLISWSKTFSSRVIPMNAAIQSGISHNKFRTCKSCYLQDGSNETCSIGHFVIIKKAASNEASSFAIGKVLELLQVSDSIAEFEKRPSLFLLSLYSASSVDVNFLMPNLNSSGDHLLVDYKDVFCIANTQHNCLKNNCSIALSKRVFQERESTKLFDPQLSHINPEDLLLNCAQMRNYHYIQHFHTEPPPMNREFVIHEGAAREVEIQRSKKKSGTGRGKNSEKEPENADANDDVTSNNAKNSGKGKGKKKSSDGGQGAQSGEQSRVSASGAHFVGSHPATSPSISTVHPRTPLPHGSIIPQPRPPHLPYSMQTHSPLLSPNSSQGAQSNFQSRMQSTASSFVVSQSVQNTQPIEHQQLLASRASSFRPHPRPALLPYGAQTSSFPHSPYMYQPSTQTNHAQAVEANRNTMASGQFNGPMQLSTTSSSRILSPLAPVMQRLGVRPAQFRARQ